MINNLNLILMSTINKIKKTGCTLIYSDKSFCCCLTEVIIIYLDTDDPHRS